LFRSVGALLAYGLVAVAFNWPLPAQLGSQLTGGIDGDTGVYVWNVWLFRHEIVAHQLHTGDQRIRGIEVRGR